MTTDPWQGSIFEPGTLHRYFYARNNAVMFVDQSGEFALGLSGLLGGISLRTIHINKAYLFIALSTAVALAEPPMRLYRYTSKSKVAEAMSIGFVVGDVGVTWWTDEFFADVFKAKSRLSLKFSPRAWMSVLLYRLRDCVFGPTEVGRKWGMRGGANEYWTFKPIPFWTRSPKWGFYW